MKNKIIFKTLMLKGEAGSTIVSMEKTGHVGTADIYTITFNDGSTTEISLENMSAITSVEKTSSTDTEDIYTITCADGSTQTFSVLNHNADIAAMSDDIDTIDARVDNFINSVVPNTVETLWTGSIKDVGDSATLSKAVSNFDYIDLYLLGSADSKYIRVPATQTAVQIQQQNLSDDASSNFLRLWEMGVSISGSTVSITKSIAWAWDDPNNSNPTVTANAQNADPITRIDGVKVASDTPAEVTDIRVGADGTTYNSAGAAVRGQISDLKSALIDLNSFDLLRGNHTKITYTANNTKWTWNGEVCTVETTGQASASTVYDLYRDLNALPSWITAGKSYYIKYSASVVKFTIYKCVGGTLVTTPVLDTTNYDGLVTIPSDATGIVIRFRLAKNDVANENVSVTFANYETNQKLQSLIQAIKNPIMDKGSITGIYSDVNNITDDSIYFVSTSGGQPTASNTPYYPCWIITIGIGGVNSNMSMQVVVPYNTTDVIQFRRKASGTWSDWKRSDGWLQPVDTDTADETGKTDMTGAIMSMLTDTGYCHLAEGIYYVSGSIDIPSGATLEGCGSGTIIRLLGNVTSGYICRLKEYSTISNIRFSGGYSDGDISDGNIGGRKGVIFIGNRDGQDTGVTPSTTKCCQVSNCWFENLDSGIYGYNSGGGLQEGMIVSDCYFTRCKAGINLDYWTEYCKFTNIVTFQCYYGCINNGGNNVFTACTFHGVIGFLIDNSGGNKQNCGHGTLNGCTFNHIDNMNNPSELGKGLAVKIIGIVSGFIIANCQLWYGRVHIESSKGIQITGCEFGGLGNSSYPAIETSGNDMVFIDNSLFQTTPSLSISSPIKITNCWTYSGAQVTIS